jgi:hypothetical protein
MINVHSFATSSKLTFLISSVAHLKTLLILSALKFFQISVTLLYKNFFVHMGKIIIQSGEKVQNKSLKKFV